MSDSHGNTFAVHKIIDRNLSADMFIHLGDGEREMALMREKYPYLDIRCVSGNCDWNSSLPPMLVIDTEKARIFCTHGHRYYVKQGTETLRSIARDNGCNIVLFGHTHQRYNSYEDGIYIMNPGSCSQPRDFKKPSYGFIDITEAGIVTNIVEL
jgi:putative phosphoesterase